MKLERGHRSFLYADIERSTDRDNRARPVIRAALYEVLQTAFAESGIDWSECSPLDRGDAVLVLVPSTVDKVLLVDPLLSRLQVAVHQHNSLAGPDARIRLRVGLNAGEVTHDEEGWSGDDLDATFRLTESDVLRRVLARNERSGIAVAFAPVFYDGVVRHGYGPADLVFVHPVDISHRDRSYGAWIWVPGYATPDGLTVLEDPVSAGQPGRPGAEPGPDGEPEAAAAPEADGEPSDRAAGRSTTPSVAGGPNQSGGIVAGHSIHAHKVVGRDDNSGRVSGPARGAM
ncbi:MAG: hypothetical protein ACJ73E_05625 [Mycobacteriales bacterium]